MNDSRKMKWTWTFVGLITAPLLVACVKQNPTPPSPSPTRACTAPASWFPVSQTPKPDPNVDFNSFCDFHKWAWQSFLWLTQTIDGRMRFVAFPTNDDVVDSENQTADRLVLKVRARKLDHPLDEINQAGQGGVLVDQDGRAVYFSQHVNELMFNDIVGKQWNDPAVLNEIPPTTEFKTGDVELKIAWKIVSSDDNINAFFTEETTVDKLVNSGSGITIDHKTALPVQVALVGLHVVGWVKGHPEAIWATFEQNDNAPEFVAGQSPSLPVSSRDWTFYEKNTPAIQCNQLNLATLTLDEETQKLSPVTQACRQYPFGMLPTTHADDGNLAAIKSLNQSVWAQLQKDSLAKNYFEVGAVWTNGDLQPNNNQQDVLIGSNLLSNATIETFTQNIRSENNCFQCHNTLMYNPTEADVEPLQGTNINLSHIITGAYISNQPDNR